MKATELQKNVYWVGAVDRNIRNFHGYSTPYGTTYNAYLVIDEKITLIDTVKAPFANEMLERINSVIDVSKIDYIISNHAEPDHSGAITEVLKHAKKAVVLTAAGSGERALQEIYGTFKAKGVKSGESLKTGKYTFNFVATPMVHWPDNMVSFMTPDNVLFSNDAFGQHYAADNILDSDNDISFILHEAKKYYANIVQPYSANAAKALEAVKSLSNISMICDSHGVVWKKNIKDIVKCYEEWISGKTDGKALVIYDTMWGSTEKMARAIYDGFREKGFKTELFSLKSCDKSDIITKVMTAEYIALGSPTLNNNMLPDMAAFLCYYKGLVTRPKKFVAFGSYGWGGQAADQICQEMTAAKMQPLCPSVKIRNVPTCEALSNLTKTISSL